MPVEESTIKTAKDALGVLFDKTQANMEKLENRLNDMFQNSQGLQDEKIAALRGKLNHLKHGLYKRQEETIDHLANKVADLKKALENRFTVFQNKEKLQDQEIAALRGTLEHLKHGIRKRQEETIDRLANEVRDLTHAVQLTHDLGKLNHGSIVHQIADQGEANAKLEAKISRLQEDNANQLLRIAELENKLAQFQNEKAQHNEMLDLKFNELQKDVAYLISGFGDLRRGQVKLQEDIAKLHNVTIHNRLDLTVDE